MEVKPKFNVGDKVTIIPNRKHEYYVKEHYGKTLEIENIVYADVTLYKVKGIKNYAEESDLQLV